MNPLHPPNPTPQDARRAFKALAYKRYQHVPLYLEWAPKGIFSSPPPPRPAPGAAGAGKAAGKAAGAGKAAAGAGKEGGAAGELLTGLAEAQADDVESSSIFVKNLAWGTGEAALKAHFDAAVSAAGGRGVGARHLAFVAALLPCFFHANACTHGTCHRPPCPPA